MCDVDEGGKERFFPTDSDHCTWQAKVSDETKAVSAPSKQGEEPGAVVRVPN